MDCQACSELLYWLSYPSPPAIVLCNTFYNIFVNLECTVPLFYTAGMCDVPWKKNITLIYKVRYKFFVRLYIDTRCIMPQQAALLSLWSDSQVHMCATFQSSSLYTDWHHISYRYTVCCNLFFSEYAWHCFPLECQCYGCFTSYSIWWDFVYTWIFN